MVNEGFCMTASRQSLSAFQRSRFRPCHQATERLTTVGNVVPVASGGVSRWNIFETRNGSNQATRQWVCGTQYVDEVLLMDANGDPATSNDCDPDTAAQGELGHDRRFFPLTRRWPLRGHGRSATRAQRSKRRVKGQNRNWNVIALTLDTASAAGRPGPRGSPRASLGTLSQGLTEYDDGVLRYVYDGWNRLRQTQRSADSDTTVHRVPLPASVLPP
jgi:hypothetical protein